MLHFADDFDDGRCLCCDVCIVGSGPAALAAAAVITARGRHGTPTVVLLESGDERAGAPPTSILDHSYDSAAQRLYRGEFDGSLATHRSDYLTISRLRHFGGTSNVWSGWCWPLEPQDFYLRRIGQDEIAWPITYSDLFPYYQEAQEFLGLNEYEYDDVGYWCRKLSGRALEPMELDGTPLRSRVLQFKKLNTREQYGPVINRSPVLHIVQNANVTGFDATRRADQRLEVRAAVARAVEKGRAGRVVRIRADAFILAAGAIETTRILLLSRIGASSGHLGRHLIEHPYLWEAARIRLKSVPLGVRNLYFASKPIELPGGAAMIATAVARPEFADINRIGSFRVLFGGADTIPGTANISWEQVPNLMNRIELAVASPPDLFGQPCVKVHLHLTTLDDLTAKTSIRAVLDTLARLRLAEAEHVPDLAKPISRWPEPNAIVPGNHPMGTTRMSYDSGSGVVDPECRVHETTNLYVASSSVFPLGGYANPTLTVVALARRLGQCLKNAFSW